MAVQEELDQAFETVMTLTSLAAAIVQLWVIYSMHLNRLDFGNTPWLTLLIVLLFFFQFLPLIIVGRNQGWFPDRKENARIFRKDPLLVPFLAVYLALSLLLLVEILGLPSGLSDLEKQILWVIVLFVECVYVLVFGYTFSRIFRRRRPATRHD
jgi:hypothetical protein